MYGYFGNFCQEVGTDTPPPILVPGTNCQYKEILYTPAKNNPEKTQFFRKIFIFQKKWKKSPKRPKNRVFELLCKFESLLFARNDLKWSVLLLANFLHKSHIWENSRSRDLGQKWAGQLG